MKNLIRRKLKGLKLTNRKWSSVVCTLIDSDIRHHSGDDEQWYSTVVPQYSTPKKVFISERDQNHDSKKEQAFSITFSQYDWIIFQNERS